MTTNWTKYDAFKEYQVTDVQTVKEFLDRYYKPERRTPTLLANYEQDIVEDGFTLISRHDNITGQVVSFYPPLRQVSNEELADLSDEWENSRVDTRKYYDSCLEAYEVEKCFYLHHKANGIKCQIHAGRYYVGR